MSFRARLTLFSAAGIALVLLAGSAATYVVVRAQLRDEIDASLREHSTGISIIRSADGGGARQLQPLPPEDELTPGPRVRLELPRAEFGTLPLYVELIDATGKRLLPAPDGVRLPVSEQVLEVARSGGGSYYADVHVRDAHLRLYVTAAASGRALLVARSLSEVDRALSRLGWGLGITCLVGVLLAAVVGLAVARGALRPVRRLTVTAERVAHTRDLGERIETDGNDELGRLGATFNAMLDSLEGAIRSQRQLVADASHELRTPLTSLRTNIDLLRQGPTLDPRDRERLLRDVSNEIEELTRLVADLVDLARGGQRELHLRQVRLDEVADVVVGRAQARFSELEFDLDATEATVWGDPEELERAVWNLVENAAKWSNGRGSIELTVSGAEVVVRDRGPGVPAADRPFVFDRFYRSETARGQPGSGLGLAIVRQIAETHGGRVEVEDAAGGGARFRLSLVPADAREPAYSQPASGSKPQVRD